MGSIAHSTVNTNLAIAGRFQILKIELKIFKSMLNTDNKDSFINLCKDQLVEVIDKDHPGFRDKVDSDNKSFLVCIYVFIACKFVSKLLGKFFSPNYQPDAAGFVVRKKIDGFESIFISKESYKSARLWLLSHESNIHILQLKKNSFTLSFYLANQMKEIKEKKELCFKKIPIFKEDKNNIKKFEYLASKVEVEAFLHEEIKTIYFFLESCR